LKHPVESYLEELAAVRASGAATKETSGYPALANLLNAIGQSLKPKVRCIIQLANSGAGLPDGGFFAPEQLKNSDEKQPLLGQKPSRGVVEVKGTADDLDKTSQGEQVADYLAHYGLLLLTNYREFRLLRRGPGGMPQKLETFSIAEGEAAFWLAAAHPRKTADALGERCAEYLKRVLLHAAPLNNPKDVAFFLASYARDARARVEAARDLPQLAAVRTALEEALGMKFGASTSSAPRSCRPCSTACSPRGCSGTSSRGAQPPRLLRAAPRRPVPVRVPPESSARASNTTRESRVLPCSIGNPPRGRCMFR